MTITQHPSHSCSGLSLDTIRKRSRWALALIIAMSVAACGGAARLASSAEHLRLVKVQPPLRAPGATVRILSPAPGAGEHGTIAAHVLISGFHLLPPAAGRTTRQDYGHFHFMLDHGRYDQPRYAGTNGRLAIAEGVNGYYSPAYLPTITYKHIPPGRHTLQVQLVNTNDAPTGVQASVTFSSH